jgi:hypothetical protein
MKQDRLLQGNCEYELWKQEVDRQVNALPHIDLDDYVPREFHDKTCEAMAKTHQEEIADLVSVVRCKECKYCNEWEHPNGIELYCNNPNVDPFDWGDSISFYVKADDFCSYGEREGE